MQPSKIGGGTVEVTVLVGGATQMLRLLQICPFLQSALVMQPTLMGGEELEGAGGGAATQMLCSPQICPLAQSALVMQPYLMGGTEEAGAGALLDGAGAGADEMIETGADEGATLGALEGAVIVDALASPARRTIDAILNCIV